jgi:hypothetical protein
VAKLDGLFKYEGTFRGVTFVDSKTWGQHIRAERGTYKRVELNEAFKKSGRQTPTANHYAKAIRDVFLPYISDFKDGKMWSRLLSFFKKQLSSGETDLTKIAGFEFHNQHRLYHLLSREVNVTESLQNSVLEVAATTSRCLNHLTEQVDSFQQTLVSAFYTADLQGIAAHADSVTFPFEKDLFHEHRTSFDIPDAAAIAVVALKCDLLENGQPMKHPSTKGMEIVKVLKLAVEHV